MKRNIDDFDGMKDFIISIITVLAWVLIGTIVIIGYFTIETKGESLMLSFISTIFTIISSLGISATIGVYFWQKNDLEKQREKKITAINNILSIKCKQIYKLTEGTLDLIKHIKKRNDEISKYSEETINYNYINVYSETSEEKYLFKVENRYPYKSNINFNREFSYTIKKVEYDDITQFLYLSASLDMPLFLRVNKIESTLIETNHILDYLVKFNITVNSGESDSFISYMEETLDLQLDTLCELFHECTGGDLESEKLPFR